MHSNKDKMIGYCGYNCYLCAARSEDINIRRKMVEAWQKYLGHEHYTAENVKCEGCKSEGGKIADKKCKARPCARNKGFESCAQCNEFPCDKVQHLITSSAGMLIYRSHLFKEITEEEFNLCVQQWNSVPNLINIMVKEGKLPHFTLDRL
jgi:hypothetical protein